MRDPNRIPAVLKEVERIWLRHPDWRLGQLIENLAAWAERPAWDLEEGELIREIHQHLENYERLLQADER